MTVARPHVFTIPASAPFVPTLIGALIGGKLVPGFPAARDPLALARATLYLPTRRAGRLMRDCFLDATRSRAERQTFGCGENQGDHDQSQLGAGCDAEQAGVAGTEPARQRPSGASSDQETDERYHRGTQ